MDAFKLTGYAQMRLVSRFEIVNHVLVVGMILGACGTALWLWTQGQVGAGAVAAVTAMALRVAAPRPLGDVGSDHPFESVGTIRGRYQHPDAPARWWTPPARSLCA